jgi:hypothetical protein
MADTDGRTHTTEHSSEEDWVDFAREQSRPEERGRLQRHLDTGCTRCVKTVRLWKEVLGVADQEASYRPPDEVLRQLKGDFALHRPEPLLSRAVRRVALVFDSFRQPLVSGVRAAGVAPRQLLYKAGRYTIRLRLEPASDAERMSIIGQILDEQDPAGTLQDIAVLAVRGSQTLDRTLTNHLGEFLLEPDAAENLQLCVGVAEIGTFTVQPGRRTRGTGPGGAERALDTSGRRRRARQR